MRSWTVSLVERVSAGILSVWCPESLFAYAFSTPKTLRSRGSYMFVMPAGIKCRVMFNLYAVSFKLCVPCAP
jgi:hypothetical protein